MSIHKTTLELSIAGNACELPVTLHYEYMPAERGARERSGLQLEPDYPAGVSLYSADVSLGGSLTDITFLLSRECIQSIEDDLLVQHEEAMQPDPDDYRDRQQENSHAE